MLEKIDNKYFFDNNANYLGRIPTNSNIFSIGSDNSLYFGMVGSNLEPYVKKFFKIEKINDFVKDYGEFNGYGKEYEVVGYINYDGQLQIKITSGLIRHGIKMIFDDFVRKTGAKFNKDYAIFLDFSKRTIWFGKVSVKETEENDMLDEMVKEAKKQFPNSLEDQEAYFLMLTKVRNSNVQENFKQALIVEFDGKCAICSLSKNNLLVASHIKPYCLCDDTRERIDHDNGLLLCSIHDALFDKGLISFDEDGKIMISSEIINDKMLLKEFNINEKTRLSNKYLNGNRINYLKQHNFIK